MNPRRAGSRPLARIQASNGPEPGPLFTHPLTILPPRCAKAYVACTDATIKVFVEGDRRFTHAATLRGHSDWVYGLALSRDGARLASASADGTVKLWNTADEKLLATIVRLAPKTDRWLIVARDGWFAASAPETVRWKMANLSATPEKLAALQNPEAVRQTLAGEPPAAPTFLRSETQRQPR